MSEAEALYGIMLEDLGLGEHLDPDAAKRHVKALQELTSGLSNNPDRHLTVQFQPVTTVSSLVVVSEIPYTSLCAHHMLPFWGHATVAYIPNPDAKIVGLSKIARCFQEYAARPQVQERIGQQMIDALLRNLDISGAGVAIRGTHSCMALRGVKTTTTTSTITNITVGAMEENRWHAEYLFAASSILSGD